MGGGVIFPGGGRGVKLFAGGGTPWEGSYINSFYPLLDVGSIFFTIFFNRN